MELNPRTDRTKLRESLDARPQVSLAKPGINTEHSKQPADLVFSDFGVSYKEVSDLGKLVKDSKKINPLNDGPLKPKGGNNVNS